MILRSSALLTLKSASQALPISLFALLAIFIILILFPSIPFQATTLHAQPTLLQVAERHPETMVSVIVQKTRADAEINAAIERLGGRVFDDLSIIDAVTAKLPAGAIPQLARAEGIRWISLDAPVEKSGCTSCVSSSNLVQSYIKTIGADRVWNEAPYLQGQGISVAVVDSGVAHHDDLNRLGHKVSRILVDVSSNVSSSNTQDWYGHGTYVAGVIGGNGTLSKGAYVGVAPQVNLVDVKVSDDQGIAKTSDVVRGLAWIWLNRTKYNIRVVNLSLNSSVPESYNVNPIDAAAEVLWLSRVVVVVSAGNNGVGTHNNALYPPANDPFVITVGAADDKDTIRLNDDVLAPFSAYGLTVDQFAKPDLVAPGVGIVSTLAGQKTYLYEQYPDHAVKVGNGPVQYFRMSGTSVSAPMVAGAAALLLQSNPKLTPDQVKARLKASARPFKPGSGAGMLDIYAALHSSTTATENTGPATSQLLGLGTSYTNWTSLNWNSVNWDSVNWDSVNWDSVNWDSVNWDSDFWGR